jgi:DTW domain-containing protein YfiP
MPNRKSVARMREFRCPRCQLRQVLCICDEIPRIALATRVVVVMHWREARVATNSARIMTAALPNSEIRLRGGPIGVDTPLVTADLLAHPAGAVVLFPSEHAAPLTPELWQSHRERTGAPPTLIVPDGTWSQARRMVRREALFKAFPHVKLPPEAAAPSRYVKPETAEGCVSSFEAIARALGIIESREVQARLETLFEMTVERIRYSRGMLTRKECRFPIPEAALKEAYEAGCRAT